MKVISILLADDHRIVRQGVRALLEAESDLRVIGEAADGLEAVRLVNSLKPDVLVVDLIMDGMNGIEVTRETSRTSPGTKVVILSMYGNEAYVLEALQAGAQAYVIKESGLAEIVHAIHKVMAGRSYLSSPLSQKAIDAYRAKMNTSEMNQ